LQGERKERTCKRKKGGGARVKRGRGRKDQTRVQRKTNPQREKRTGGGGKGSRKIKRNQMKVKGH